MPNPALLLSIALLSSSPGAPAAPQQQQQASHHGYERLFISPMGEPFRASAPGDDPLVDWFRQADTNHDGSLSLIEFANDGVRFFRTLDTDHDGKIGFDEIHRYEWVVAPEIQVGWSPRIRRAGKSFDAGPRSGTEMRAEQDDGSDGPAPDDPLMGLEGAGRFGLLNIPEPVTAADTDLNHQVTAAEFTAAASSRFELLDTNHDKRLDLAELEALLPKMNFARNKHHRHQWRGGAGAF
jgi:Ca2+-binding EF-hand superfamily protein